MRNVKNYEDRAVCVSPETAVLEAADEMDSHSVGCVVVVDDEDRPLGMLTDRDLVLRVVAEGRDPDKTNADDVMTREVLTCGRRESTLEVLKKLEERGVRRAPLVEAGHVVGLISIDDLMVELGAQLWNVSEAVRSELRASHREAPSRRRRESREEAMGDIRQHLAELGDQIRDRVEREIREIGDRLARRRD